MCARNFNLAPEFLKMGVFSPKWMKFFDICCHVSDEQHKRCRFADGFVGLTTIGRHMTTERLLIRIRHSFETAAVAAAVQHHGKLKPGGELAPGGTLDHGGETVSVICELMVHPGYRCQGKQT